MTKREPLQCARLISKVLGIGLCIVLLPIFLIIMFGEILEEYDAKKYFYILIFCAALFLAAPAMATEIELSPVNSWFYEFGNPYNYCDASPWTCVVDGGIKSWWVLSRWTGDNSPSSPGYNTAPTDVGDGNAYVAAYYYGGNWSNKHFVPEFYVADQLLDEDEEVISARILATQNFNQDIPYNQPLAWFFQNNNGRSGYNIATSGDALTDLVASITDSEEIVEWDFNEYGLEYLNWQLHNGDTIYLEPLSEFNYSSTTPQGAYPPDHMLSTQYKLAKIYYTIGTSTPEPPATPPAGNLSIAGLSIAPNWFCCYGSCGYPLYMLPQLGWWGIGATTSREVLWGLDNAPITNSIDFTNQANALINIPTSTALGYHTLHLETYIDTVLTATGSTRIQIVAGEKCAATFDYDLKYFCTYPCAGLATSSSPLDFDNFLCGMRKFGCWAIMPTPTSISYVMGQFNGLTANFPMAPFTKLYDDLTLVSTGTQTVAPGNIEVPYWSTSTQQYVGQNFDLGSSTLSHSYAWTKFRRLEVIGMWCVLCVLPIVLVLIRLIV
jgi:hypothetical protein